MDSDEESQKENAIARRALAAWQNSIKKNIYQMDSGFKHSIAQYLVSIKPNIDQELTDFADKIVAELEPLVIENNLPLNLPRIEHDDPIGNKIEKIIHHPTYEAAGNIIYGSRILERMARPGGLLEALVFMFLSSQAGEAGHNCPLACSGGIIRVLQKVEDFPSKSYYLKMLVDPSYSNNFTGAQFITEIQGGSDVGQNATLAYEGSEGNWYIKGEKWFCSNADAELMLVTARFNQSIEGTSGLGLFLVPAQLPSGERNNYTMRRLKDKIGTRSLATAEIEFHEAFAIPMGTPSEGFKLLMENVLHLSRLFNTFCVLGMARRAYFIALSYAKHRVAFGNPIIDFPLVKENLARINAENTAMLAFIFATTQLQDDFDLGKLSGQETKLLLRSLANLNKYLSALWSVEHIHHALDTLAGNGAIESFSTIPRLLRDCIVCENWEGTHNILRMQILRDILRYHVDEILMQRLQAVLANLKAEEKYRQVIEDGIKAIKKDVEILKAASAEMQSLLIKSVVDQFAILFCAVHLLSEAISQKKSGDESKFHCLDYFIAIHFSKRPIVYDQTYLDMIKAMF